MVKSKENIKINKNQSHKPLIYPLTMLYARGIKENQQKSTEIEGKPILAHQQCLWWRSGVSDDPPAPTMVSMDSGKLHDASGNRTQGCRGQRWPECTYALVGSLEIGFKTRYGSYPQRRSGAHEN